MTVPDAGADEFDTAFAEFSLPEPKAGEPAAAAAAATDGAAVGAGDGSGDASAAAEAGVDAGAGAAGGDDAGAADASAAAEAGVDAGAGKDPKAAGAAEPGAGDAGSGDAVADAAAAEAAAAAAAKPADADADAILAGLKKLVGEKAPEPAAAKEPAAETPPPPPAFTAEEQTRLTKYEEDWKEVSECEALKRRAEYQALLAHVFKQVVDFVKPIQETADVLAQRTFTSDVRSAVPDYSDQLRAEVVDWVKTQPTYLQVAYNHVVEEGTVDEVKDLVDRYRTATGKAPKPAAAGGGAPKANGKGNELSDEAKKAAAALAPVDSKRSGVIAPSDPSNFDDAWKEAATGLG